MCANFQASRLVRLAEWMEAMGWADPPDDGAYLADIYPGDAAPVLAGEPFGRREPVWRFADFGMAPDWAKPEIVRHTYNARSETVAQKPSFRQAWRKRQFGLVFADAFFEPRYTDQGIERCRIEAADGQPLALAALWDYAPSRRQHSFTLLTVNADQHAVMQQFHAPQDEKRMPLLLPQDAWQDWLQASPQQAQDMLQTAFDWPVMQVCVQPRAARRKPAQADAAAPDLPQQASLF
ncbi:SOS response-associated peptidase family protein [Massilia sp. W12]|uniref:SOS response-associated peptidase n=1 Tax=Massilia sp. W12 TaxID=3126507 RepID=UPI0030CDBB9A